MEATPSNTSPFDVCQTDDRESHQFVQQQQQQQQQHSAQEQIVAQQIASWTGDTETYTSFAMGQELGGYGSGAQPHLVHSHHHAQPYHYYQHQQPYQDHSFSAHQPAQQHIQHQQQSNFGMVGGMGEQFPSNFSGGGGQNRAHTAAYGVQPHAMSIGVQMPVNYPYSMTPPYAAGSSSPSGSYMHTPSPAGSTPASLMSSPRTGAAGPSFRRPFQQRRGMARMQDSMGRMSLHSGGVSQSITPAAAVEQQQPVQQRQQREMSDHSVEAATEGSIGDRPGHSSSKGTSISSGASFLPPKPDFVTHSLAQEPFGPRSGSDLTARPAGGAATAAGAARRGVSNVAPPPIVPTVPLLSRLPSLPPRPVITDAADAAALLEKQYQEREDALLLRIEAIGFEPEASWSVMHEIEGVKEEKMEEKQTMDKEVGQESTKLQREPPAPILGIRLLQRVDHLQRENEELSMLLAQQLEKRTNEQGSEEVITKELQDAHGLIQKLDEALTKAIARAEAAEANAQSLERALAVACAQSSSAMTSEQSHQQREGGPAVEVTSKGLSRRHR